MPGTQKRSQAFAGLAPRAVFLKSSNQTMLRLEAFPINNVCYFSTLPTNPGHANLGADKLDPANPRGAGEFECLQRVLRTGYRNVYNHAVIVFGFEGAAVEVC